jgi:diguanylate cyclase (GGDEF)-like protein
MSESNAAKVSPYTQAQRSGFEEIRNNYKKPGVRQSITTAVNDSGLKLSEPLTRHTATHIAYKTATGMQQEVDKAYQVADYHKQRADNDDLTGVISNLVFIDEISTLLENAQRYNHRFAYVLFDVNGLKIINDSMGHLMGDMLLRKVGDALNSNFRGSDFRIRLHGDEFVVIMPETELENIEEPFDKFMETLGQQDITIAAGAIMFDPKDFPKPEKDPVRRAKQIEDICETLKREADELMYKAKDLGKDPEDPTIRHSVLQTTLDLDQPKEE